MKMKMILPMMLIAALPLGADAQNKSGLVMSNLDQTVKPADSFYQFATGGWQKNMCPRSALACLYWHQSANQRQSYQTFHPHPL